MLLTYEGFKTYKRRTCKRARRTFYVRRCFFEKALSRQIGGLPDLHADFNAGEQTVLVHNGRL